MNFNNPRIGELIGYQDDFLPDQNINFALPPMNTLSGVVLNEFGEPLAGAHLSLKSDPTKGTTTDFDGNYTFSDVANNEVVVVSWQGVKVEHKASQLPNPITLNVTNQIDEVVITASKKSNTIKYLGIGLLAFAVIVSLGNSKTVKAKI